MITSSVIEDVGFDFRAPVLNLNHASAWEPSWRRDREPCPGGVGLDFEAS